jgi:hypothetical protein
MQLYRLGKTAIRSIKILRFVPTLFALSVLIRFPQADSRPSAVLIDEHNTRAF